MEKIMKGYVFRLYPNDKQIELIEKSFGCSRYIYNYFLSKNKNYINSYNAIKEIPNLIKENTWLSEVDSCLLRCSIFNLEDSFKRYKNGLSEYPKFKSKNKTMPSYRTNNITSIYKLKTYNNISIDLEKVKEVIPMNNIKKENVFINVENKVLYKYIENFINVMNNNFKEEETNEYL